MVQNGQDKLDLVQGRRLILIVKKHKLCNTSVEHEEDLFLGDCVKCCIISLPALLPPLSPGHFPGYLTLRNLSIGSSL